MPKEKNKPLQSYGKWEITGSVLGPVHISIEIFIAIQIDISNENQIVQRK